MNFKKDIGLFIVYSEQEVNWLQLQCHPFFHSYVYGYSSMKKAFSP